MLFYKMEVTFDKDADALYIEFNNKMFFINKKIDRNIILDFDEQWNLIGIEILNMNKNFSAENN